MMRQILTPDLSATVEVDVVREHLVLLGDQEGLAAYQGDGPRITIGYLPASKITELMHRQQVNARGKDPKKADIATLEEFTDICREWARWGVRGHTLPVKFDTEATTYRGKPYSLAGPVALDLYERNDWLAVIYQQVQRYNTLPEEKKTPSSSSAGTDQLTSTADCASKSPR